MERQPIPVEEQQPISHREEREIFNRQWVEDKQHRRQDNVQHFTGFLGPGRYIHRGVGQPKT